MKWPRHQSLWDQENFCVRLVAMVYQMQWLLNPHQVLTYSHEMAQWKDWRNEPPYDKTNKVSVHPAKTQISLGIRPVWSESSLSAWRKLGSLATYWAHSEDWSDWAYAQADPSLRWAHMPFCWFSHEAAQMFSHSLSPMYSSLLKASIWMLEPANIRRQKIESHHK